MFPSVLSLGVPNVALDMTADFAPLFVGLVVTICLGVLALAFAIGVHDTQEAQQKAARITDTLTSLPRAA